MSRHLENELSYFTEADGVGIVRVPQACVNPGVDNDCLAPSDDPPTSKLGIGLTMCTHGRAVVGLYNVCYKFFFLRITGTHLFQ